MKVHVQRRNDKRVKKGSPSYFRYRVQGQDLPLGHLRNAEHLTFTYAKTLTPEEIKSVETIWRTKLVSNECR